MFKTVMMLYKQCTVRPQLKDFAKIFLSNFKKYLEILCRYLDNIEKNIYSERKSENVLLQEREGK